MCRQNRKMPPLNKITHAFFQPDRHHFELVKKLQILSSPITTCLPFFFYLCKVAVRNEFVGLTMLVFRVNIFQLSAEQVLINFLVNFFYLLFVIVN